MSKAAAAAEVTYVMVTGAVSVMHVSPGAARVT